MDILNIKNKILESEFFIKSVFFDYFKAEPIGFMDVGARGGTHALVEPLHTHVSFLGFEPDLEECEQLNQNNFLKNYWNEFEVLPHALSAAFEKRKLNIISAATNSSLLEPNSMFVQRYNMEQKWHIVKQCELDTVPLDHVIYEKNLGFKNSGEIIKLDTQGTEFEILQGAKKVLNDKTVCVVTEVEFFEIYKGQQLFSDVDKLLRESGFSFYGFLTTHTRSKKTLNKQTHLGRERLFYADAVFFKDPLSCDVVLSKRQQSVLLFSAILTGYYDFALELVTHSTLNLPTNEQENLQQLIHTLAFVDPSKTKDDLNGLLNEVNANSDNVNVSLGKFMDSINFPDFEDFINQ